MTENNTTTDRLFLLPYGDDPIDALAQRLLQDHHGTLPRLEHATVLLPDTSAMVQLRQRLLHHAAMLGHGGLLGPQVLEWRSWLSRVELNAPPTVSDYRRELILLEALREHGQLFGTANLWALTDSLLTLFDELTLNRVGLPRSLPEFTQRVATGYGLHLGSHSALDREAELVHTLWHAWHEELHARETMDRNTRYLLQLAASLEKESDRDIYLLSPGITCEAELEWLQGMLRSGRLTLILHGHAGEANCGDYHPEAFIQRQLKALAAGGLQCSAPDGYSRLLDSIYSPGAVEELPLRERAGSFAGQIPISPLTGRLVVYAAESDEQEARAVELQVRRWLLDGKQRVGIVTENRRLARRVRALLERAGVNLDDAAGWALSTTSAAAVLERWLQCIEEDFPHRAMLDLLKSPFFAPEVARGEHLTAVYRLEQDIVLHENIGSGLERYISHLHYRQQRLPEEMAQRLGPVAELLIRMQRAATSLQSIRSAGKCEAAQLLESLQHSLDELGITPQLGDDAAGMRLLEELQRMQQAVARETIRMDWLEFRSWLGRTLERYTFKPPANSSVVSLMGLSQTALARFDALVIAGCEREFLPGTPPSTPFFNDAVRGELGLPTAEQQLGERFYHFRRLLEASPRILISRRQHTGGEELAASPWLEILEAFHQLAYRQSSHNPELESLLNDPRVQVVQHHLPIPSLSAMPRPGLIPELLPQQFSASAYQQLLDCPYQFYAARALGLAPPEAIREALEKSDYGERVHRCLEAMHGDVPGLPGPYTGAWVAARREEAILMLQQISEAVFARDLEDNFLHRGWLQRWLEKIPGYIDWQIERAATWRVSAVEQRVQQDDVIQGLTLHGRLDRCDSDGARLAIIDYKTGGSAGQEEVLSGEAVQLPFYALLARRSQQPVARVEYLSLDGPAVASRTPLADEQLEELSELVRVRLDTMHNALADGATLPAWGDEKSCNYCRMSGICRRQAWQDNKKGD